MFERLMVNAMNKREKQKVLAKVWPTWKQADIEWRKRSGEEWEYFEGKTIGIVDALAAVLGIEWIEADVALRTFKP